MNKLRIVIDTNVIVSALIFFSSNSMQALTFARENGVLLTSIDTLAELNDVLSRPKFNRYITQEIRADFLASLANETEIVDIKEKITECRDSKDNKFLELAVSGNADILVIGDQDLLVLHPFRNTQILIVTSFLSTILTLAQYF